MGILSRLDAGTPAPTESEPAPAPRPRLEAVPPPAKRTAERPRLSPELSLVKAELHGMLLERHAEDIDPSDLATARRLVEGLLDEYSRSRLASFSHREREAILAELIDDALGLGPLEPLLADPEVSEIMINGPDQVFVERAGRLEESSLRFSDSGQLMLVIDRIVSSIGRRVDESSPMADARLRDGSRVNVVIPPLALRGACLTIRKFSRERLRADDLVRMGSASAEMMAFLRSAVRGRLNILVSGGTSSGKTTLLNVLSGFIPEGERIVTVEDAAELQLQQVHVIPLESRPPNIEGRGAVAIRDLVRNSLRMRPDRIVVGEVRGAEALDMLQAMNTGHDGSMSTLHANSPADATSRLETMAMMAGTELPAAAIRSQIASSINLVVQTERVQGGARKIVHISELTGLKDGELRFQDLFSFRQTGVGPEGDAIGRHEPAGRLPLCWQRLRVRGEALPESIFRPAPR